jgi:branched-chain amino acid aminotransferase
MSVIITLEALEAIKKFQMPEDYGFGTTISPIMVECDYENGKWGNMKLIPYAGITLDPTAKVFHYAQEVFEGMKAYSVNNAGPSLFRPLENIKRFNKSAVRMAMPEMDESVLLDAIKCITSYSAEFIPRRSGESLYIRPFMIATEGSLGIKPSESFKFLIVASPSGAYFSQGTIQVMIERNAARACPGGTGWAKTGGNYAGSLITSLKAKGLGFQQILWLDAAEKKYIEEMEGMNFFAVVDGKLYTPAITDTILEGITRKSLMVLAEDLDLSPTEDKMSIDELLENVKNGKCTEAFACGTAAIITPIAAFGEEDGARYPLTHDEGGPVARKLRDKLLAVQEGREKDLHNWVHPVEPAIL